MAAIRHLPRLDLFRLAKWVQHRFDDEWDKEIAKNALAGDPRICPLCSFSADLEFPPHRQRRT